MPTSSNDVAYEMDLEIYRGSTFDKTYTVKKNNEDWDLSGMTGRLVISTELGDDGTDLLALTTASGLAFGDGSMRIVITTAQSEALAKGKYYWDVLGKESGVVYPIGKGRAIVKERVTDPDDIS